MILLNRRLAMVGGFIASGCAGSIGPSNIQGQVQDFSLALQARLPRQPPLFALYSRGDRKLGFVGARHAIDGSDPTFGLVQQAFDAVAPAAVIIEGTETAWNESPSFLVEKAKKLAASENRYSSGEAVFTAQLAIQEGVPFWGGEPRQGDVYAELLSAGYDAQDSFYASLYGPLAQSVREGALTGPTDSRFDQVFERWARFNARGLMPPPDTSAAAFRRWHYHRVGVTLDADSAWLENSDPDYPGPFQEVNKAQMRLRDQHLLELIFARLESHRRVVVTYGGSHLATLWQPLVTRLGRPKVS